METNYQVISFWKTMYYWTYRCFFFCAFVEKEGEIDFTLKGHIYKDLFKRVYLSVLDLH